MNKTAYLNLVTYRNSLKEKYMAFMDLILDQPMGSASVTDSILFAFDLDNACGKNLDIIGDLVGVDRLLPFVPTTGTREMNDDEYRMLIRLKIARNVWDGRNEYIKTIYNEIFPALNITYMDNQDMTITLTATGVFEYRQLEIFTASGYILVPAGVGYTVIFRDEGVEFKLYVKIAQHGELIIDRMIARTEVPTATVNWAFLKENRSWDDLKDIDWGDLS